MSKFAIEAEKLGKKYLIGHQSERERYTALRDVMAKNFKNFLNKTRHVLRGEQLLVGDEIEEFWALKDISFKIAEGDRVGIIGRNGAGKSTLLKILSRITEPSNGRVEIKGRVASLLEVGTGFHPELTGRENIYLNGAILGMTRTEIRKKFDEIVDFAGVAKFLDTPVKRYSSGMYVRLAFAVAAHLEPEILVVDEVLAVGDAEFQKRCLGKMEEVSKNEGRTVLFVSHNMEAVQNFCNNAIVLNQGSISFIGDKNKAIETYLKNFQVGDLYKQWDDKNAPGTSSARFYEVKIEGYKDLNNKFFYTNDVIEFTFKIKTSEKNRIDITYHLRDEFGILVYVGSSMFSGEIEVRKNWVTYYSSFPANILNAGTYTIKRLLIVKNKGTVLAEINDVVSFELLPIQKNQLGWQGEKEGVLLLPSVKWKIRESDDSSC